MVVTLIPVCLCLSGSQWNGPSVHHVRNQPFANQCRNLFSTQQNLPRTHSWIPKENWTGSEWKQRKTGKLFKITSKYTFHIIGIIFYWKTKKLKKPDLPVDYIFLNLTKVRPLFTLLHRGSDNSPLLIVFKWTLYELCLCIYYIMISTNQVAYL